MTPIPERVRATAIAAGEWRWPDALPALVADLERDWSITVGQAYDGATEAFVAEATTGADEPAVLKVPVPQDNAAASNEATVLRLAGGAGCVKLLRHDPARGALLLERLGRSLSELGLPIGRRHEILCSVAERLWRPAPDCGLPTGADKGRRLAAYVETAWDELDRPCARRTVDHALECASRRIAAHDDERAVLVHGDVHQWNTLRAGDGYKLVDPDGLLAEAEYDMGIVMREDAAELMHGDPRDRARWLAARTGLDPAAIWEWGVVERTSNGLLRIRDGMRTAGYEFLAVADRIARDYAD